MKFKNLTFTLLCIVLCGVLSLRAHAEQITLVQNGKSTFTIVIPANAPTSVQNAAQEMQTSVELATGVKLPLLEDDAPVSTSVVSLGNTQQAKTAGFGSETMADESFRIVTRSGNLYILGPDTPNGGWTKNNGVSNGTAHGVYTFLEDYLGVRWLMPGDIGRDVPKKSTFVLEEIDRSFTPMFSWRRVTHIWDHASAAQQRSVATWAERQRLGGATQLNYDHNWWRTINGDRGNYGVDTPAVKELYKQHPEWFAMDASGNRPLPTTHYAKLETTNQELVRWFADKAIAALKSSERPVTYSLSPSDGGGRWSKSPESVALYDPSPSQLFDPEAPAGEPGMSSLVLKWYHDVAQIVAKEYPEGRLAGYIYSSYVYPPTKVAMKLPDNFTPVICGIGTYGYGLYRPDNQERWKWVMDSWAEVAPEDWYYYDLPNQLLRQQEPEIGTSNFPGSSGIITPAAPDILNTIFPQLVKSRIKGAYVYGVASWSNAALGNYLLAKMEWDPTQNAEELQREWLHRAYGLQAGVVMEEFYAKLNGWFRDYYQQNDGLSYKLTLGMLRDIYAAHYPEMEKLLLKAKAQPMSGVQKRRLQLLEDNLIVLQWRLRNAGFLPMNFTSPLQRNDAQINDLLTKESDDFALFPGVVTTGPGWVKPKPLPWQVEFVSSEHKVKAEKAPSGLGDSRFLIYASQDGEIRITPQQVSHSAYFASYQLQDENGRMLQNGILQKDVPLIISAKANSSYTLTVPSRKPVNYQLLVENAAVARGELQRSTLALSGRPSPAHVFYIPQSTPVGIFAERDDVIIKKPFSGAVAEEIMGANNTDAHVLNNFDEGWKFSPDPRGDGVERGVLQADFDDSDWKTITALDWWQMQGFPDYHGVAWYRMKFTGKPINPKTERARLYFGAIDGNAEVYLNGKKLMERTLGPGYEGWDKRFSTSLNHQVLPGENILVVKVISKNDTTASGMFKGAGIVAGKRK